MISKEPEIKPWSFREKVLFRFLFISFSLFVILVNNGVFPFFGQLTAYFTKLLHSFIPWFAESFLSLSYSITVFSNGSGDTTYDYVLLLCIFLVSLAVCVIWTFADRQRLNYNNLFYALTVIIRFYVGLMLIQYGLGKIIKIQFPFPDLNRLTSTYGESTPMGLAWTFMGFSKGYNLFMGIIELMGILLLFRKTVTLGAIISLMTTAHIMAINYFYDVPVKILSTALFLMCVFILAPNLKPLFHFFLQGKVVQLKQLKAPVLDTKRRLRAKTAFQLIFIVTALTLSVTGMLYAKKRVKETESLRLRKLVCGSSTMIGAFLQELITKNATAKYIRKTFIQLNRTGKEFLAIIGF